MTDHEPHDQPSRAGGPFPSDGAWTAEEGTAAAVDVTPDLRARANYVVLLAGPVIWSVHFMAVYLVTEAGCADEDAAIAAFAPPVPEIVTLVATVVAAIASVAAAVWAWRRWRAAALRSEDQTKVDTEMHGAMAFVGLGLSVLALFTVLAVGVPAAVLPTC